MPRRFAVAPAGRRALSGILTVRNTVGDGMFRKSVFAIAMLLFSTAPLFADSSVKGAATLEKVIRKIADQQKLTTSLEADFRQEKVLGLLAQPEVSTGTFVYAKPNRVLWTYENPKPVTMLIADGWLTTYYPQLNRAEKLEVKRFEDRIFKYIGASGAIDELGKYFDFSFVDNKNSRYYTLELKPKTKTIGKRVQRIKIWIDRQTYLTSKFEYVEGDGDMTRYEFTNIRRNNPIPTARFTLSLPSSVRVEQMRLQ